MFPTTHDITPDTLDACLYFLANILRPGNRVLIVSKPHLPCVQRLCADLRPAADRVQFRFTIGADDDALLRYWEPGAPPFAERFASLAHAHAAGFRTSVSAEPLLDAPNVQRLVDRLRPHITDTLWIGKLNCPDSRIQSRPGDDPARLAALHAGQTHAAIRRVYDALRADPIIRWKESYRAAIGLDLRTTPDTDI